MGVPLADIWGHERLRASTATASTAAAPPGTPRAAATSVASPAAGGRILQPRRDLRGQYLAVSRGARIHAAPASSSASANPPV